MGCTKSKVVPQQTVEAWASTDGTGAKKSLKRSPSRQRGSNNPSRKNSTGDAVPNNPNVIQVQESTKSSDGGSLASSRDSIASSRTVSASSKTSAESSDSGLGVEYSHVITEKSLKADKENAELQPGMTTPNPTLQGQKLGTPPNSAHRKRLPPVNKRTDKPVVMPKYASSGPSPVQKRITFTDSLINELPDNPNIIKRPSSRGGMAFDIVMDGASSEAATKKRPTHLQRLEEKHEPITLRDLVEKQRDARMRREGYEQMRLERIRAQKEKNRQVTEALEKFSAMQKKFKAEAENKMRATSENREAHLNAVHDGLKEELDKVEVVKNEKSIRKLPPLRHPSVETHSTDERPINLGAN